MRNLAYWIRCCALTSVTLGFVANAHGQLSPMAPFAPTSNEQCQTFSQDVNRYWAKVNQEHEECLASHKADKPNEQPGSRTCSRSSCQWLHDQLYDTPPLLSGKTRQQQQREEVSACFNTVTEYLKRQAQAQREEADRKATRAREEEQRERQKIQADRASAQKSKAATAQKAQGKSSTNTNSTNDNQSTSAAYSQQSPSNPPGSTQPPSQQDLQKQKAQEALDQLQEPFEKAKQQRAAMGLEQRPTGLVDPFPDSHGANAETANAKDASGDEGGKLTQAIFEHGIDSAKKQIDRDIEYVTAQWKGSKRSLGNYVEGAKDTKSVVSGVGHVAAGFEYGSIFKDIYEASHQGSSERLRYQEERLAAQVAHDTVYQWTKDAVQEGVKKVVVRMFPKTATYLTEGASAAAAGISITFYSADIAADPPAIIEDKQGKYSLEDKQRALFQMWKFYDRNPTVYAMPSLINDTDIVYRESLKAQSGEYGAVK